MMQQFRTRVGGAPSIVNNKTRRTACPAMAEPLERRMMLTTVVTNVAVFSTVTSPTGHLYEDSAGDFFGVGSQGVYELPAGSTTDEYLAYASASSSVYDMVGGVASDGDGNLYGLFEGDISNSPNGGVWNYNIASQTLSVAASFSDTNGSMPFGTVYEDSSGNLFGTAESGGANSDGTVWELPAGSSTIIDEADFNNTNGASPMGGVVMDSSGDLFGTSSSGDASQGIAGTLWELPAGSHTLDRLALLPSPDAGLVTDGKGDYFGSDADGIFEWNGSSVNVIGYFDGANGNVPSYELTLDSSGDVFGASSGGTGTAVGGSVFEIPAGQSVIHPISFFGPDTNGEGAPSLAEPSSPLVIDSSGNLFGTTSDTNGLYEVTASQIAMVQPTLAFSTQPTITNGYNALSNFSVNIEDAAGNIITSDDSAVTVNVSYNSSPEGASVQGTSTVNAVNGVATFTGLTLASGDLESPVGGTFQLEANDDVYNPAVSEDFSATGGGGGGGGGSGTTAALTPTIVSSTVPTSVLGGAKIRGELKVNLVNGSTAEKGYTVKIYASADNTLDGSTDALITTVSKSTVTLKPGSTTVLSIPITSLPTSLPDGRYYIIAEAVDSSGNTSSAATPSTVDISAPFVSLSETLASTVPSSLISGTTAKGTITLVLSNSGNVPSKGITPIEVTASTTAGVLGTSVAALSKSLDIVPGKSVKVVVPIKTFPALADGNYFLVAQATDPLAHGTSLASSTGSILVSAPFLMLTPVFSSGITIASNGTATASLTISNGGNISPAPGAKTQVILFASDSSSISGATQIFNQSTPLRLDPGTSKIVKIKLTADMVTAAKAAGDLVAEVIDPLGGSETTSTVLAG